MSTSCPLCQEPKASFDSNYPDSGQQDCCIEDWDAIRGKLMRPSGKVYTKSRKASGKTRR